MMWKLNSFTKLTCLTKQVFLTDKFITRNKKPFVSNETKTPIDFGAIISKSSYKKSLISSFQIRN